VLQAHEHNLLRNRALADAAPAAHVQKAGETFSHAIGGSYMSYAKQASKQNTAIDREIGLGDEEISDVSLSTFYVYDAENPATPARTQRRLLGAGGCGCGVGGGCSRGCGS
jgi:hypothetical protein